MSSPEEKADPSADKVREEPQQWGRVLLCGGTNWPALGRKGSVVDAPSSDLPSVHVLRSLSNIKAVSVHTSHSSCHAIVLDVKGNAYLFGRNTPAALGGPATPSISENTPRKLRPHTLQAPLATKFVDAACGRGHSLLVGSDGTVWSAGVNTLGQCGHPPCSEVVGFKAITGPWTKAKPKENVIKASAGITFSAVLTDAGRVFTFGSGEKGQLGNGRTGERIAQGNKTVYDIEYDPVLVKGLEGKKITQISCGQQHCVALDADGLLYVWGYNGYCRLGLGHQKDMLVPTLVPQFAGTNLITRADFVASGPTSTIVLDRQRMLWMAGKWKTSGAGSVGQPYSTFRYFPEIQACKILDASSGGVTHFATTSDDAGGIMTIAWGQNATNSELGLGEGQPKSATKPTRVNPLDGIDVLSVAAGQNTTFFIAKVNEALTQLPRHPLTVDSPSLCLVCNKDKGESDEPLECEKCDHPYHLGCLSPPLIEVPAGQWFCPDCEKEEEEPAPSAEPAPSKKPAGKTTAAKGPKGKEPTSDAAAAAKAKPKKRKAEEVEADEEDEVPVKASKQKTKAVKEKEKKPSKKR